ncbi:hypothetical protein [Legionella sp. km772]|uniref:hypothetical protein n=1 Tax=Legionella sp. km772 TaxID=2498111 RepID=UPI000F8E18E9|nr:hypothetical protein [Legionella sp. km772]RUR04618.1 hypothetical protein ELY15_15290 [Legionella sp. km772]
MPNQSQSTVVAFPTITEDHTDLKPAVERLNKIKHSQTQLGKIQKDLEVLIDAMAQNPSMLSRAANYWGKLPLWQKIVAGIIIAAPPLIIGILAQLIVCFVITAFLLASYIGSSVVLDDHYTHTQYSTKNIKTGVTSLAEGLDSVTQTLEQISQDLADQVALFSKVNEQFGGNVESLALRNLALSEEIEKLKETEKKLHRTQTELETACAELKNSVKEQTALLEETQAALNKIRIDFARNQNELEEKNKQLSELQKQFKVEVTRYEQVLETLQTAIAELAENILKSPKEQQAFYDKVQQFIQTKDANFLQIFERFNNAEKELTALKEKYKGLIDEYEQLVGKQVGHLGHIEKTAALLDAHGFYAPPGTKQESTALSQELRM